MNSAAYEEARQQIARRHLRQWVFRAHVALFTLGMILFFFWLRTRVIGYPIFLMPPALWAFVLLGHWFYKGMADAQDTKMERLWEQVYGAPDQAKVDEPIDMAGDPFPYARIRQAVEVELTRQKRQRRRLLFRINVAAYLGVMLLSWLIIPIIYGPFITASSSLTIFALSIGGLAQVVLHYLSMRLDTDDGERALRERLLGQAIQAAMAAEPHKAKRTMRLSEDGELVDIVTDEAETQTGQVAFGKE